MSLAKENVSHTEVNFIYINCCAFILYMLEESTRFLNVIIFFNNWFLNLS